MPRRSSSEQPRAALNQLRHFVRVVDDCWQRRALRDGTLFGKVKTYSDGVTTVEAPVGDDDDMRSLAASFRKLMSENDDAFFLRACSNTHRLIDDPTIREWTATNRDSWLSIMRGEASMFAYVMSGHVLHGESMLDAWMNGVVFHSDLGTSALFEQMSESTRAMCLLEVSRMMREGANCAHAQRNVVQHAFDRGLFDEPQT